MAYGDQARLARISGISPAFLNAVLMACKNMPLYASKNFAEFLGCDVLLFAKQAKKLNADEKAELSRARRAAFQAWADREGGYKAD